MSRNKKNQNKPQAKIIDIGSIDESISKLEIVKSQVLNDALHSNNINDIYKAQQYLQQIDNKDKNNKPQSLLLDPQNVGANGYKNKNYTLSYEMLRAMSRTQIIKPIIKTRIIQVLAFMQPQKDRYSPGFVIRPKNLKKDDKKKLTKEQERRIEELSAYIMNCGDNSNAWHGDDIHKFTTKILEDSLALDQATAEIIRTRGGEPCEFLHVDGSSFRIADTFNDEKSGQNANLKKGEKNGYLPYYVQVWQSRIVAEFYPWELMFGVRNPQASMLSNMYGRSELEDLIENVTSLLNADQYNSNFFKVGSNPKGILKVSGNINQTRIDEFRGHWQAQMAGTRNSHRLAIIEAEKMDFINTQMANKDMEYSKYQEFLIKIGCAHYLIDPSEIGFPMQGTSQAAPLGGEGGTEVKLKFSKDKGLKPLLSTYQRWLNKYIVEPKDEDYELVFEGIEVETPEQELQADVLAVTNFMTMNEIRIKRGLKPIDGGDIVLNPIFFQQQMAAQQGNQQSNDYVDNQNRGDEGDEGPEENPFTKSLMKDVEEIFSATA